MSAAIAALLKDWVIPRCNVHIIRTYTMLGNEGSVGVFRKNGSALSFFCPCHVDQTPLQIQTRENQEGLERVEGREARLERVGMAIGRPVRIRGYSCDINCAGNKISCAVIRVATMRCTRKGYM